MLTSQKYIVEFQTMDNVLKSGCRRWAAEPRNGVKHMGAAVWSWVHVSCLVSCLMDCCSRVNFWAKVWT